MVSGSQIAVATLAVTIICSGIAGAGYLFYYSKQQSKKCNSLAECPAGSSCIDGRCVRMAECVGNADCPEGKICKNTVCVLPAQCKQDLDCKKFPAEVCDIGTRQCVPNQ